MNYCLESVVAPLVVRLGAGERVNAIVFRVAAVAFDPMPFDPMPRRGFDELLPKLGILDWLLVRSAPAILLPFMDPARDSVANVDAVGVQLDPTRPLECFKPLDRRRQLHPIVGREGFAAGDFPLGPTRAQEHGPAARPGIAPTGPVREHFHLRKIAHFRRRAPVEV